MRVFCRAGPSLTATGFWCSRPVECEQLCLLDTCDFDMLSRPQRHLPMRVQNIQHAALLVAEPMACRRCSRRIQVVTTPYAVALAKFQAYWATVARAQSCLESQGKNARMYASVFGSPSGFCETLLYEAAAHVQAAALAEFRADWATAARMYATAYSELLKCGAGGAAPLQRHFEVAACAELFHVKVPLYSAPSLSLHGVHLLPNGLSVYRYQTFFKTGINEAAQCVFNCCFKQSPETPEACFASSQRHALTHHGLTDRWLCR